MKGIVFTELCEMVESEFGLEMLNSVIDESKLESKGVYSAVGTYDANELFSLVTKLSEKTGMEVPVLVHAYGRYFFDVLLKGYPNFFEKNNCFEFLKSIDSHIHVEVKKLYPDAELPSFTHTEDETSLILTYKSERKLSKFARGLIERTIEHFKENISIEEKESGDSGQEVQFTLTRG